MQYTKRKPSARTEYFKQLLQWFLCQTVEVAEIFDIARKKYIEEQNLGTKQQWELQNSFHKSLLEKNPEAWQTLFGLIHGNSELETLFEVCMKKHQIILKKSKEN